MIHLITIIIPMFNEEKNIKNCIRSLTDQSMQDFSVIFIDDGSTDNTLNALKNYLKQEKPLFSFTILQQKNQGAAKAREHAIRHANTPYVLVFDMDDLLSMDTIAKTKESIRQYQCDISLPNFEIQQRDGLYKTLEYPDNRMSYSGLEALEYTLGKWQVPGVMCAKKEIFIKSYELYKSYNPNEINYMNNDEVINRLNFYHSKTVVRNYSTYYYQCNPDSTTKKINPNRYLMGNNVQILYLLFGKNMGQLSYKMQEEYINVLWGLIQFLKKNKEKLPNPDVWRDMINNLFEKIRPDLKNFKNLPFKTKSRLWIAFFSYYLKRYKK